MAKAKKYKKLTNNAEKKLRKEIREKLREDGLLPPVKPKLNRKKFSKETIEEFKKDFGSYTDMQYLFEAICYMIPHEHQRAVTPEEIGAVKILKLALEIKKFKQGKINNGETKYNLMELYEKAIRPILDL